MKLLVLGHVWPEPQSSAAGVHMMSLLHLFRQQGYHIVFATEAKPSDWSMDLQSQGVECYRIQMNDSSVGELFQQLAPDVVLFDRFLTEEQYGWLIDEHCPDALKVLDMEDLHCLRHARQVWVKQHQLAVASQQSDLCLLNDYAYREVAAILRCDISLVISEAEFELLQQVLQVPAAQLLYCPFLVEPQRKLTEPMMFSERQGCLMIGNFFHAPNWDAALWMTQHIWPRVRDALPDVNLHLCGGYPTDKVRQLHNPGKGILVQGHVESVQQWMQQCRLNLAPLRFGAGLKGKVMDAMLCGIPTIGTQMAFEGLVDVQGVSQQGVQQVDHFAEAIVQHYQDQQRWQALLTQQQGWLSRFQYEAHALRVFAHIRDYQTNLVQVRQRNFLGRMLLQQQFRSTKYMAKWIEAKNKLA